MDRHRAFQHVHQVYFAVVWPNCRNQAITLVDALASLTPQPNRKEKRDFPSLRVKNQVFTEWRCTMPWKTGFRRKSYLPKDALLVLTEVAQHRSLEETT
jgi:hypothetical protein